MNLGLRCNQQCRHCHHLASPLRTEQMSWETMECVARFLPNTTCSLVEVTGGSPELHPKLSAFIERISDLGYPLQVRTNLTALLLPCSEGLPEFFRDYGVSLVASLPCYCEDTVDRQRGRGAFQGSIRMLRQLNALGYGREASLPLHLVYNPIGYALPGAQTELQQRFRKELQRRFGVRFTNLLTITNMPLGSFLTDLRSSNREQDYRQTLMRTLNPATFPSLMCRRQLCVSWDGRLFDCDFNISADLPVLGKYQTIEQASVRDLIPRLVATADHCFGCTAGHGSSCGGALV